MRQLLRFLRWLCLLGICQLFLVHAAHALVNQLKGHPSPYLAMHADDPVAWQDWSDAAVAQARREQKLLFVSIGYFSCHWCHVMQRESYRNRDIARFLNAHYIPVKVDRELEPALDARMIEFVQATRGVGGWPLNVFITPEGHPLYAVLYMPPTEFLTMIRRLDELWMGEREQLQRLAARSAVTNHGPGRPQLDRKRVQNYAAWVQKSALTLADTMHGGFGTANKFPSVPQLEFLLNRWQRGKDSQLKQFLLLTLDQMADAGLQDHLGGGFFRYTVDPEWRTPHFEKMLYDNALLSQLYLRAARAFDRPDYEAVALRSLDFMAKELRTSSGAFIASLSAIDDKHVEGGYYLWTEEQLKAVLGPRERQACMLAWGMSEATPSSDGYLPVKGRKLADIAEKMELAQSEAEKLITHALQKLYAARSQRGLPKDTKLLAGWNGLALSAFAYAARVTANDQYRRVAKGIREYLVKNLWDNESLRRAVFKGRAVGRAAVEDYAYVAQGLLEWAELTGRDADFALAKSIAVQAWKRFYGPRGWRLAEASRIQAETGQGLILDGPMPSPSGVLARVSLVFAARTGDHDLRDQALSALNSGHRELETNPLWNATQIDAMLTHLQTQTTQR